MGDVEDEYNFKKSKAQKACKAPLQEKSNHHKSQEKSFFTDKKTYWVLVTWNWFLGHMKIKATMIVKIGSIFCI